MKILKNTSFAAAALLFALGVSAAEPEQKGKEAGDAAQQSATTQELKSVDAAPPAAGRPVVYKPPNIGKPAQTVGGGSRGSSDKVPVLFVVVPDHVGQTVSSQPSLFYFIDQVPDPSIRVEFTLLDEDGTEPLVAKILPTPKSAGVHRIRLTDGDAQLQTGTEYEWSVALILDPDQRSKDIVATGWIDRVEGSQNLMARLESDTSRPAAVYAEEGLWYDAISALSDEIDQNPSDPRLRQQRQDLMRQVGLDEAASGATN